MSRRLQARLGAVGVALPNGWVLDGGDEVVVDDITWAQISADDETLGRLLDLGDTTDLPDPVPTWRDVQKVVVEGASGGPTAEALVSHINSPTPHPAYDGIGDLVVLLENGLI